MPKTSSEAAENHNLFPEMAFASGYLASSQEASTSNQSGDAAPQPHFDDQESLEQRVLELTGIIEHGLGTPAEKQHTLDLLADARQKLSQL